MTQTDTFIETLLSKERELVAELHVLPVWRQLESLRNTIREFKPEHQNGGNGSDIQPNAEYPKDGTWEAKIMFVLKKITTGFVEDIVSEIDRYEPGKFDQETLQKRVGQNLSTLKTNGKIDGNKGENGRMSYYLK
jgi:hypothetical protein